RLLNWFPLGLTYAFLYMGRYNFSANASALDGLGLVNKQEFGDIDGWGSAVYGIAFLLNGPLTDRWGGRTTILISAAGAAVTNAIMGYMVLTGSTFGMDRITALCVLYGANMYFQSFGAVSIVKVNAAWF